MVDLWSFCGRFVVDLWSICGQFVVNLWSICGHWSFVRHFQSFSIQSLIDLLFIRAHEQFAAPAAAQPLDETEILAVVHIVSGELEQ